MEPKVLSSVNQLFWPFARCRPWTRIYSGQPKQGIPKRIDDSKTAVVRATMKLGDVMAQVCVFPRMYERLTLLIFHTAQGSR
jgi:hypothetical protein